MNLKEGQKVTTVALVEKDVEGENFENNSDKSNIEEA